MKKEGGLHFFTPDTSGQGVWLAGEGVSAGFPSPADDFKETRISLDKVAVKNEAATFYARVAGQSMIGAGLDDGDLLVIDRSLEPQDGKIAVCLIDGDFTVKRLKMPTVSGIYFLRFVFDQTVVNKRIVVKAL